YGSTADASVLDLPSLSLSEFPELPDGAFPEVRTLYLKGNSAPVEQTRKFVRGFTGLEKLDVSGSGLTELPFAPGDLGKLTDLDLSNNRIVGDTGVQQAFDGLQALQYLDLSNNPLNTLDVSAMTRLKSLNLSGTALQEWPTGAQALPELYWLDLRDSKVNALPEPLADETLLKANLTGTPLTPQAVAMRNAALRRMEMAKGLPAGALERFDLEQVPQDFPPFESGSSIARHLLPLPEVPAGEGDAVLTKRLQRLKPTLADDEALQMIEQLQGREAANVKIAEWEQAFETLTRQLNGWLFTRGSRGSGWMTSSSIRRQAALRILECWRTGLIGTGAVADGVLDLNGLQLGDLPEVPAMFEHVGTLKLTSVKLTRQGSDGFLKAFTRLKTLDLNGNGLDAVPEPVRYMDRLEHLEMSSNRMADTEQLYATLSNLERLRWLDLSYNELDAFDIGHFEQLETLDLRNNNLTEWPDGVFDGQYLGTLNLSGND
ncbi:MAG: leucine-rich repeat domain-containing protein, partial [Pseudomonas sp.]